MDLIQVDPIGLQTAQAVLDLHADPTAGVSLPVRVRAHVSVHLRREHDVVAATTQRLPHDLLGLAVRVDVGGIDEVDAGVERGMDDADGVVVVAVAPQPEHHGAETLRADLDAGLTERAVFHLVLLERRVRMLPHLGARGESAGTRATMSIVKALLTALRCPKGEIEANARRHIALLEEGAGRGARIVAFPEMSLTGSVDPTHWSGLAVSCTHPAIDELAAATARLGVAALFGIAEASGADVYITQLLADAGRIVGHYRKRTLGEDEESYGVGSEPAAFALDQKPIGIAICAEGAVDEPFDDAAASGAAVVFFCSAPGLYGRRTNEKEWRAGFDWWSGSALGDAARHARRLGVWIALSTQAGRDRRRGLPRPRRARSTRTAMS